MKESVKTVNSVNASLLTPRQVAEAIGVSESSVKRWCDIGRLRTVRTPGGHRRIPVEAVLDFTRRGDGPPLKHPTALALAVPLRTGHGGEPVSVTTLAAARRELVHALLSDDLPAVHTIVETQRRAASGFDVVADEVIAPALFFLGERWSRGELEVYQERRACGILHACLHALGERLPRAGQDAPHALGGTLEGDPFTVATSLAEIVLRERGFDARSLGSWLPADSFASAITAHRPRLVWLSVGHAEDPDRFVGDYAKIEQAARTAGAALVIGGRALEPVLRRRLRYSAFCDGMVQLASFAEAFR